MKYVLAFCMIFGLWACENRDSNQENMASSGGESGSAGAGGSAGVIACGAHLCGACDEGCIPNDQCVDGEWQCRCECGEGGSGGGGAQGGESGSAGEGGSAGVITCGAHLCGDCDEGCIPNDQCVDGEWLCRCECGEGGSGGGDA